MFLDRSSRIVQIRQAVRMNSLERAKILIAELSAREPDNFEGPFWRGYLELRQANYYDAVRDLRRAEALNPSASVLKTLAVSYYALHQYRLFLLKMREAIEKDAADFAPYYYIGRYYDSELTDFPRAAEYFQQALARNPDHIRSHYYLGYCHEVEQKFAPAELEYTRALERAGKHGSADGLPYQGLSRIRMTQRRTSDALPLARRAVELGARNAASHKLLARVYSELGRNADAAGEWKIASTLDPTDASILYRLFRSYLALGQAANAQEALSLYKNIAALYGTN